MTTTDVELLREFTRDQSQDAFTTLVERHLGLVYCAALRQVHSPQLAEEVAQSVFTDLAQNAARLKPDTILTAWLYEITRRTAINVVRGEARRQLREQIAFEMNTINATAADWTQIEPLLDEAMHALDETDRTAVLLRYFENKSLREVGAALGTSDDTAQKRVSRALERLREFFAKRGVTVGAGGLVVVLSANAVQAAPTGLAQCLTVAAIAKAAVTAGATTSILIPEAFKLMASKKLTTFAVVIVLILLAIITTTVVMKVVRVVPAGSPPDIQGAWEGVREFPNVPGVLSGEHSSSRIVFRFTKTNGTYRATGELIDSSRERFQVASFSYDYPSVRFDAGQNKSYQGMLNAQATEISGVIHDRNSLVPLLLKRTAAPSAAPKSLAESDYVRRTGSDLQGRWEGMSENGADSLPLIVKIAEPSTGQFRAELDIMAGPWLGMPMSITYNQRQVQLRVASGAGMFEGTMNNDASEMVGQWVQGGVEFRTTLRRADQQAR